ncbi:recombinase family protein [Vibrio vulnificus]|nr:recombinase family protein [Vibrio vulnificus]
MNYEFGKNPEAQVYLYIRFSRKTQEDGDSERRQYEYAKKIAQKYNLTINHDLRDRGYSAFKGTHRKTGKLGRFIQDVDNGIVAKGSILIVESLDRLSREAPFYAQKLFNDLMYKGITVITSSDEAVYNEQEFNKRSEAFYRVYGVMQRAFEESDRKQLNSIGSIKGKIARVEKGEHTSNFTGLPFWITNNQSEYVLNSLAEPVKLIVNWSLEGVGATEISRRLAEIGIKSPQGKEIWGITTISNVLKNHSLFGKATMELNYTRDGVNIKEPYEFEGIYPSIISEDDFNLINARKKKGHGSRAAYMGKAYLLSAYGKGVAVCAKCGSCLHSQNQKQYSRVDGSVLQSVLRLHCGKHRETKNCSPSIKAKDLENALLDSISREIDKSFLEHKPNEVTLEKLRVQIDELKAKNVILIDTLTNSDDRDTILHIQTKLKENEKRKKSLESDLKSLEDVYDGSSDYSEILRLTQKCKDFSNVEDRRKLKSILINIVNSMVINLEEKSISINFNNNRDMSIRFNGKKYITTTFDNRIRLRK